MRLWWLDNFYNDLGHYDPTRELSSVRDIGLTNNFLQDFQQYEVYMILKMLTCKVGEVTRTLTQTEKVIYCDVVPFGPLVTLLKNTTH